MQCLVHLPPAAEPVATPAHLRGEGPSEVQRLDAVRRRRARPAGLAVAGVQGRVGVGLPAGQRNLRRCGRTRAGGMSGTRDLRLRRGQWVMEVE